MKTLKQIIATAVVGCSLISLTGCDFLDKSPDDQLNMEMVFSDKIRTEDWLASVYAGIPSPMWGYMTNQGYNIMSDDMVIPIEWSPYGWNEAYAYTTGNWNPSSTWNANYWVELPKRIRTGLIFLNNVRVIPSEGLTQDYVEQMKNEVRFLNAYYYSLMVEAYGAIPFAPGRLVSPTEPANEMMLEQTPVDDVVDWIDKELLDVSKHLPAVYENNQDWGRATSIMALAVRAKTLLLAASPLFNGNTDYAQWKNVSGKNLVNQNFSKEKWERAAAAHAELIKAAEAAGHKLYYEYNDDGTIDPFMSYYNMSLKRFSDGNKEIIFGRAHNKDLENWQRRFIRETAYNGVLANGNDPNEKPSTWQQISAELLAHPILGVEVHPSRYFFVQASYNHGRRMEMITPAQYSLEGFAWGLGVQVRRVAVRFSRAVYHLSGASNHLSVALYFSGGRDAAMRPYVPSKRIDPPTEEVIDYDDEDNNEE